MGSRGTLPRLEGETMKGFRDFILKGNLIELAVAFIMASAFATVVKEFTAVLMGFVGKAGGEPNFDKVELADVTVGLFINAVIAFLIVAAVVYFFVVTPYQKAKEKFFPTDAAGPTEAELLVQIRDLLATKA
jgi:large conductance mechanosensitive channel